MGCLSPPGPTNIGNSDPIRVVSGLHVSRGKQKAERPGTGWRAGRMVADTVLIN